MTSSVTQRALVANPQRLGGLAFNLITTPASRLGDNVFCDVTNHR